MTPKEERLNLFAAEFLGAWNTQDVEKVVACYSPDLLYRDPNTRGVVEGADALRHYLGRLFERWTMTWHLRELFPLDGDGAAVLWRAGLRPAGAEGTPPVEIDGMDLVILEGDLIRRNEVYFDRALLS